MVTKAIILSKKIGTNKYNVRIPWLENSGGTQSIYEATVATSPSIKEDYNVDDVVYVAFEDRQIEKIVIVGKLYLLGDENPRGYANLQALNVSQDATLPLTTTIGGVKAQDLVELVRKNYVFANLPEGPDTSGTYALLCDVSNEDKIYYWGEGGSSFIPEAPDEDGEYVLVSDVEGGIKTYSWEIPLNPASPVTYEEALAILRG